MEKFKLINLFAILLHILSVSGFEPNICSSALLLNSGLITLRSSPPNIEVRVPKIVKPGEIIEIKIKGLKNVSGLAIQAKSPESPSIGKFTPNIEANFTNCASASQTLAIYRKTELDSESTIKWEAPVIDDAINFRF